MDRNDCATGVFKKYVSRKAETRPEKGNSEIKALFLKISVVICNVDSIGVRHSPEAQPEPCKPGKTGCLTRASYTVSASSKMSALLLIFGCQGVTIVDDGLFRLLFKIPPF